MMHGNFMLSNQSASTNGEQHFHVLPVSYNSRQFSFDELWMLCCNFNLVFSLVRGQHSGAVSLFSGTIPFMCSFRSRLACNDNKHFRSVLIASPGELSGT